MDDFQVQNTQDEVTEGDFTYRLVTEKKEYQQGEPVRIYAELVYTGDREEITIYHAASPFYFPMVEKTRGFTIDYPMEQPLVSTTLKKGEPIQKEYRRSGGYGSQDEKAYIDFMKSFLEEGFPAGYYVVNGFADFYVEWDENGEKVKRDYRIEAEIDFKVK
ncbi:MAG: hypothetical protein H0Z33_06480 [Bacillaceae bacterium]|nr:hypothetical protein [Bacillaceae bacterium]